MNNNGKYNRQLKLVGLCMANNSVKKYDAYDLAEMFDVEYITIQRDLSDLRKMGIPVSQTKNGGIEVEDSFSPDMLSRFLLNTIGSAYSTAICDIAVSQGAQMYEMSYLKTFMQVIIGIESKKKINSEIAPTDKTDLSPLKLFQKDSEWYLLASSNTDGLKHYAISNLDEIKVLEYNADHFPDEKIEAYIRETVFSNFKRGNVKIKLQFASPDLEGHFPMKHCNYKLTKALEAGSTEVEAEVDSLDEVVKWLVENTPEVKILEPPELISKMKHKITDLIKMTDREGQLLYSDNIDERVRFQKEIDYEFYPKKLSGSEQSYSMIKISRKPYNNNFSEKDFSVSAVIRI